MSFPSSFSSQLAAIMEALLKAVVTEVTALVEDGAVELRLELRDRERQILEKERDIEERDRVIEELRAAVEELTAREEAALRAEEEREEERESQQGWNNGEEDTKPVVKSEPIEEFSASSTDPHLSLWPPPPLSADSAVASSFNTTRETAQSYAQFSQETEDFSHTDQPDLPVDTFLTRNQDHFYTAQPGFSLMPELCQVQNKVRKNNNKKKSVNETNMNNFGRFRCDQCGKTFTSKCRLVTHQSVHTGAKPYSCEKCGKKFSRNDSLARHKRNPDVCCKDFLGLSLDTSVMA